MVNLDEEQCDEFRRTKANNKRHDCHIRVLCNRSLFSHLLHILSSSRNGFLVNPIPAHIGMQTLVLNMPARIPRNFVVLPNAKEILNGLGRMLVVQRLP
jgi:hypothetical protein